MMIPGGRPSRLESVRYRRAAANCGMRINGRHRPSRSSAVVAASKISRPSSMRRNGCGCPRGIMIESIARLRRRTSNQSAGARTRLGPPRAAARMVPKCHSHDTSRRVPSCVLSSAHASKTFTPTIPAADQNQPARALVRIGTELIVATVVAAIGLFVSTDASSLLFLWIIQWLDGR